MKRLKSSRFFAFPYYTLSLPINTFETKSVSTTATESSGFLDKETLICQAN